MSLSMSNLITVALMVSSDLVLVSCMHVGPSLNRVLELSGPRGGTAHCILGNQADQQNILQLAVVRGGNMKMIPIKARFNKL